MPNSVFEDASIPPGERSFRVGWFTSLKRTDGSRPEVTADYVARQGKGLRVIDIRPEAELPGELGYVPGSDWVPFSEAGSLHLHIKPYEPTVLVCDDGRRSSNLAGWLETAGLKMVAAMRGGVRAWRDQGFLPQRSSALLKRMGALSPLPDWAAEAGRKDFTLEDISNHVGDPRSVRWIKVAAFLLNGRLSCVDGRDHVGVVGSPGGDAGEFVLALAAIEQVIGRSLSQDEVKKLLRRRLDTFGHFAFHTDTAAGNLSIAAIRADPRTRTSVANIGNPLQFRQYFNQPPLEVRDALAEIMVKPEHTGCGHLRLAMQHSAKWGVRDGLTQQVLSEALKLRWAGVEELEFTPLSGTHSEGAVLNIRVSGHLDAYSRVPLVSPSIGGHQMFINHPDVTRFLRGQMAQWLALNQDLFTVPTVSALFDAMQGLHEKQLAATLGELAAGLPVYDVTVQLDGRSDVKLAGHVPGKTR